MNWLVVLLLLLLVPAEAQYDVFLLQNTELVFVDLLTGEETVVPTSGERYTVMPDGILFYDPGRREVMVATPDGSITPHPFIQMRSGDRRIDWHVGEDQIAWTTTFIDSQDRLATRTYVAGLDGADSRLVFTETDETGSALRALPLAFSADGTILYMDAHPDGIDRFLAFNQYVGIFALDLESGEKTFLPGEQGNCICGAAFHENSFLRLRLTTDLRAFDLHVINLVSGVDQVVPALRLNNYDTGGDVMISDDGNYAIYALARISDVERLSQSIQTIFVLVDLRTLTQEVLTTNITTFVRPVAWTEDNARVIFTSPTQDATWKVSLEDGRLERIANARYLGTLRSVRLP